MKNYIRLTALTTFAILYFSLSGKCQFITYCYEDKDGDGYGNPNVYVLTGILGCKVGYIDNNNFDCDDTNPEINPNTVWYRDFDNDGFRSWTDSLVQCTRPAGGYKLASELNSALGTATYGCSSIAIQPNFTNTFDCNELVANPYAGLMAWFLDADGDGAIASFSQYIVSCGPPPDGKNYISSAFLNSPVGGNVYCKFKEDCNDNDPLENIIQGWYLDGDNDGFPLNNTPEFVQCRKPAGPYKTLAQLKSLAEDCNDLNAAIFPGTWYEDKDGDGLTSGNFVYACNKPDGYIFLPNGGGIIDCDDTDKRATIVQGWYKDADGDGHGIGPSVLACKPPVGYFTQFELKSINDCNDQNNKVYPGAPEICNGIDDDCDGLIDEKVCCPVSNIVFVNANASGANNGNSWFNAYKKLQDGLDAANRCAAVTQVWVAVGTYYPDEGVDLIDNDRNNTFSGRNKLAVYGGFIGNEISVSERNMSNVASCILNGDILKNGDYARSYNVVRLDGLDTSFVLDGFTIKNGNAASLVGPVYQAYGGGIIVLSGGATINNCIITANNARHGGALANLGGSAQFTNCVITGNSSASTNIENGLGIVYNSNASPAFFNCTIANNDITGNIFYNNTGASVSIFNSIIRGASPAISGPGVASVGFSNIQNATVWPGLFANSNADPLFVNEAQGDLRLTPCSPAVNSGSGGSNLPVDLLGQPRPALGANDMGAYELQSRLTPTSGVLFVNAAATGNGSGSSWTNAVKNLQYAIKFSCDNTTQIWVAKGTYYPTSGTSRDSSFTMRNNLAIYGGFTGTETQLTQRNWNTGKTILSGDIGVGNNSTDNSYNVVRNDNNGLTSTAILDGFTITGGNASSAAYVGSVGGAIFNRGGSAVYRNCTLTGNQARVYAGGFFSETGSPLLINCIIAGNVANIGAGSYSESSTANMVNCTFAGNLAPGGGGAFFTYGSAACTISNCIMWANSSGIGVTAVNSLAPLVSNTLLQGGYAGTGNINADPMFTIQPAIGLGELGNLRLLTCSPAVDAGNNAALPAGTLTDVAGNSRIIGSNVDMGAYEKQTNAGVTIYLDLSATGNNEGTSWANAFTSLEAALNDMNTCSGGTALTLQIAAGTYVFPLGKSITIDNLNAVILGGYPKGGGTRNAIANPVLLTGNVKVLKSIQVEGVRLVK